MQGVGRARPGRHLRSSAHYALAANTKEGCQLPLASSDAQDRATWTVCSQQTLGVHTGVLSMKQITRGSNFSFFNCRTRYVLLWVSGPSLVSRRKIRSGLCVKQTQIFLMVLGKAKCRKRPTLGCGYACTTRPKGKRKERNPFPQKTHLMRQLGSKVIN